MRVPPSTRPIHIFVYIIALLAHPSLGNCLHIPPSLRSVVNETFTLGGVRAKQGNTLNWMDWSSVMTSLPSHKILIHTSQFPWVFFKLFEDIFSRLVFLPFDWNASECIERQIAAHKFLWQSFKKFWKKLFNREWFLEKTSVEGHENEYFSNIDSWWA